MKNLTTVAMGKALKSAAVREAVKALPVGEHEVDAWVHLYGTVTRGEDYDQRITPKAKPWRIAAAAIKLLAEKSLGAVDIAGIVKDSLNDDLDEVVASLKGEAAAAMTVLKGATMTRCNGKVTHKLTVTEHEAVEA